MWGVGSQKPKYIEKGKTKDLNWNFQGVEAIEESMYMGDRDSCVVFYGTTLVWSACFLK